ncbi:hypothetical protein DTO013E5_9530 [Penicillium roqueforti]|uniref:Genomic scaffold, ProqFM164S02 n=1 Tax=Penicillium roqueforti (strain FM164) TaxID=1365484 RepID=W6Q243_PENRF|nr:uncharacterized protein LCP9604111_8607 [Penicillium roqueforti]CDM30370.1 unnamed protein product [Penicillium roqueforti FM164]KAF9240753.1 hypothetical protein LCP9604111_8607 [Penicillium roqueforti]KAI1831980.1 hypothetical protein CBS147337_7052 [Penicillium roqueforti]KAI2673261.1 hypothetical protein CBS147355_7560 [Penicillium roqueforti]KAI2677357.1 hypothetical protein LCP963914a_8015 [Penicillium roqueforti]
MTDAEKNDLCMPVPPAKAIVIDHDMAITPDPEKFIGNYSSNEVPSNGPDSPNVVDLEAQPTEPRRKRFAHFRYVMFTVYRRLFTVVFCANLAVFLYVMISDRKLLALVNATAVNLVACGLARHPMMVNAIYRVVCSIPRKAPLSLRRRCAKAAHYGGVHSGCGTASLVWYIGFVAMVSQIYWTNSPISTVTDASFSAAPIAVAYVILALLVVMVVVAYPTFRRRMHDYFELTHRFTSWLILALFVALVMLFAHDVGNAEQQTLGYTLVTLPAFWLLIAAVFAVAHPWLLLRRVPVKAEPLSSHAVRLSFDFTPINFAKGVQVSKHPLRDWHSFAGFPDPIPTGEKPFVKGHRHKRSWSIVVSKAGDWTADTIREPPTHLWKRGALMRGVGYGLRVFDRIIIVTTGSGIGPCLGFLGDENRPLIKVIWQTRNPVKTYGQDVIDLVHKMGPDPIIFDTSRDGRVDMLPIVRQQVKEFKAEAVFVISNPKMTQDIVYEFESQGIPAYGPIFDS